MYRKRILGLAFTLLLTSTTVLAESNGSAVISHWYKHSATGYALFVSNISDSPITVYVDLYEQFGHRYTEASEGDDNITITGFSGDPTDGGGVLAAKSSGYVTLNMVGYERYGSGVVRWTSTSDLSVAATAFGLRYYASTYQHGHSGIEINDGKPF